MNIKITIDGLDEKMKIAEKIKKDLEQLQQHIYEFNNIELEFEIKVYDEIQVQHNVEVS